MDLVGSMLNCWRHWPKELVTAYVLRQPPFGEQLQVLYIYVTVFKNSSRGVSYHCFDFEKK